MELFKDFHWPTFVFALAVFFVISYLWNLLKYSLLRYQAEVRAKKADASLKLLMEKLKAQDREIADLMNKIKGQKS